MSEEKAVETADVTTEQIEAAQSLLSDNGFNVLSQEKMSARLAKERSKPERDLEALRAEMDALKASHGELQAYRKGIEDKDKSDLQLWEDRKKAWDDKTTQQQADLDKAISDLDAEKAQNAEFMVAMKLRSLLTDPINEDMALLWAKNNLTGLSVDDSGNLLFTEPTGDVLEGDLAVKKVSDWWAGQKDLQRPKSPGPDTKGNASSPPPINREYQPLDPSSDYQDRIAHASKHNPVNYRTD